MKPIKQTPIRDRVYEELLKLILRGKLPPGSKVKDTDLAEHFVVSRTPVRETLLRLEREGFVENRMGRGFVVRPLTRGEMKEVYPILWTLESFALRSSAPLPAAKRRRLKTLAGRMNAGAKDPMENIDLDAGWHSTLLGCCGNEQLLAMIESLAIYVLVIVLIVLFANPLLGHLLK